MKAKRTSSGVFWIDGAQRLGQQLSIAFAFRKRLIRAARRGFIWIRPDGKQIECPTPRSLVKAIMNYDGVWLRRILAQAEKLKTT